MTSDNGHLPKTTPSRIGIDEMSRRLRSEMIPIDRKFSYFLATPLAEEDLRQYLQDPVAAMPPAVCELLPSIGIVLAPWLERAPEKTPDKNAGRGTAPGKVSVVYEKPSESRLIFSAARPSPENAAHNAGSDDFATLFFTVKDEQVSDYHYYFFDEIAALLSYRWSAKIQDAWHGLLREELSAEAHGEVDERSWRLKQSLLRRPMAARKDGKPFRDYARQSFEDTMTLYLHGICCDIDVETGPRQIPSRYLRKRLEALKTLFPPPEGHAVFPEDLAHTH